MAKVIIYRAADAFLYLPTYIAEHRKIFQTVDDELQVEFNTPGGQESSDILAIRTMIEHSDDRLPIVLCDPLAMFSRGAPPSLQPEDLRLIGALITKPSFWGVNKKSGEFLESEMGNHFEKVIYYHDKFATGNVIGKRLQSTAKITDSDSVDFGKELGHLLEEHKEGKSAIAVTADIVGLAKAHNTERNISINHWFSKNPRYSGFLTTGLMTTADVCKENPDALKKVVEGIQRAIFVLRSSKDIAFSVCQEIAKDRDFYQEGQENLTEDEVSWIIDQIHAEDFYPNSLAVSESQWIKAVEARKGPELWTDPELWKHDRVKEIKDMYQIIVHQKFIEESKWRIVSEFGILKPPSPSGDTIPPEETTPSGDTIPPEETTPSGDTTPPEEATPSEDISELKKILPLVIGAGLIAIILLAGAFLPIDLANLLLPMPILQISVQSFMLGIVLLCISVAIYYDSTVREVLARWKSKKIVRVVFLILIPMLFGVSILLEIKQKPSGWALGLSGFLASMWIPEASEFVKGKKSTKD